MDRSPRLTPLAYTILLVVLAAAVLISVIVSASLGSVDLEIRRVLAVLAHHVLPMPMNPPLPGDDQIVWQFRVPRALLAVMVGAGLAVVGTVLQAVLRNPLADPFVLGISSGAALGSVIGIAAGFGVLGGLALSGTAFAGALLAMLLILPLARVRGSLSPNRLLLAGVALSYLFYALTNVLIFMTGTAEAVRSVLFWLLGSLAGAEWHLLTMPAAAIAAGTVFLMLQRRVLNALLAGDDQALSLGIEVESVRKTLLVVTSLLTGVLVAVSGGVGFVGLIVPHAVRLVVGADHRRLLPAAALAGAVFLIWADVVARTAFGGQELPLSVVTALVGVPFFLVLMRSRANI